jgi:hypothetical protein
MPEERPLIEPQCLRCVWLHLDKYQPKDFSRPGWPTCTAFPKGIPDDIWIDGTFDHTKPHEGDHGIRYLNLEEE